MEALTGKWAKIINPKDHPQWKMLLDELSKYDPEQLKDFHLSNNETEITVGYYIKLLKEKTSPRGQSGTTVGAAETRNAASGRGSNDQSSGNRTNATRQGSGSGNNDL